ncbi:MAG: Bug family tripartite tricarboxylate transporter substrate binding protein [Burkholderiales bacterium]
MKNSLIAAACLVSSGALAQDFPTRPITVVVPFGPGGPTDIISRVLAQKISTSLGQTLIVSNVPGGGGSVGTMRVAAAKPDGYTLLMGNMGTHVLALATSEKLA